MNEQKSTEVAGHFDAGAWLCGEPLDLKSLLQLARGVHPIHGDWPPPNPWDARWRRLKMAIDEGRLSADLRRHVLAGKWTIVYLADLWAFVTEPVRLNDDAWAWGRDFCRQWAEVLGKTLADAKESQASAPAKGKVGEEPQPRRKRGRPSSYKWDDFQVEITRIANTPDGLPEIQADLEEIMAQWCEDTWGVQPGISTIREKIAPHYQRDRRGQ